MQAIDEVAAEGAAHPVQFRCALSYLNKIQVSSMRTKSVQLWKRGSAHKMNVRLIFKRYLRNTHKKDVPLGDLSLQVCGEVTA